MKSKRRIAFLPQISCINRGWKPQNFGRFPQKGTVIPWQPPVMPILYHILLAFAIAIDGEFLIFRGSLNVFYYNEAKLKELLMALRDDPLRIVIMLTIYYGVRRSEVLGIKWSAIDYDEELIHLRHKIIEDKSNGKTVIRGMDIMKSKSSMRSLPLMTFICEELRKEKERQEEMKKVLRGSYNRKYEEYVCVDSMGNLFKPNYVTNHFAVLLRRHGLDKIRFHDLRHSCATLMLSNGEDMKKIQGWLGHSTITITADTYAHLDAQSKRGSASVIENALSFTA